MIEIAGRLPFLTIETSNGKSQNDGEILNCRINHDQSHFTKSPFHCLPGGVYPNAQVNYTYAHTKNTLITSWSLTIPSI